MGGELLYKTLQQTVSQCLWSLQLTDGLYAPNVEQEQLESVRAQVAELVGELMGALHHEHVQVCTLLIVSV